jgi:hypothetical protein
VLRFSEESAKPLLSAKLLSKRCTNPNPYEAAGRACCPTAEALETV